MMSHRSDPTSGRDLPEGLYALPVGDGLAWLPREIPRTCWQCRHCRQAYTAEIRQVLARREQVLACRRQEAVAHADPAMAWHGLREAGYIDGLTHATRGLSGDVETVLHRWGL